jgi:hypothetical protein
MSLLVRILLIIIIMTGVAFTGYLVMLGDTISMAREGITYIPLSIRALIIGILLFLLIAIVMAL